MKLKYTLDKGAYAPERAHETDAGADLRTRYAFSMDPYGTAVIDTGVHIEIPKGYMGQVCSKSGLNMKKNIFVPNGTVDSGYTGSVVVKLYNYGEETRRFSAGDKIAQIIIQPVECCEFEQVEKLDETERGNNGFGSTGR